MSHQLIERAINGEESARHALLDLHRDDLLRMIKARLDPRIKMRVDASDIVQDTLIDAWRRLDDYLRDRPLPLLHWLRQIASERLIDTYRRHISSQCRAIQREERVAERSDESTVGGARRLSANDPSPSTVLARNESHELLNQAISSLPNKDREILIMRHIEQFSTAQIASVLKITEGAVKARLLRALQRLRTLMEPAKHDLECG